MKFSTFLSTVLISALLMCLSLGSLAQPATSDLNKNKDPMVMKPGYKAPEDDKTAASVITIDDFDNFKLGVDFAECSISNNPLNPTQFYAVWNSTSSAGGKGYFTNDGFTWTSGNPNWSGMIGDVVVAYDSLGKLAYQNMYGTGNTVYGVKVAMSSDNGQTWDSPLIAMSGSDKNWIFADQTSGPYSNFMYGTMTNSAGSGQSYSKSSDLGASWTSPTSFSPGSALPGTSVCGGPEGDIQGGAVYVVTNSGGSFSSTYTFYKSTNGGQSFSLKSTQNFANTVGTQVSGRNAVLNMRTRPYPYIAADNSYGPHRGRLYLVYASNNPSGSGNKPDIFCRYSDDGGTSWSSAKTVNDDPNSQSNHNWFPAIWCEKNTGRLYISWMDTRDCPTSDSCMIYATYTDDGVTFAPNQRISNKKMKINCNNCGGGGSPMYLGDYNGVAANSTTSLMAWTDFRDNNFGSYVAYFPDFGLRAEPAIDTLSPTAVINASIPGVKLYTDTVFVSATISGTPGLFTISYPQGNKLYSFPGMIPIQISQNGSIPPGDYTLSIVANGSNGTPIHKRTATVRAIVPVSPTASFTVNDTSACQEQALNFVDHSSGPPTSWAWQFPGGTPSTSDVQNPSGIVYSVPGEYNVSLTVTNQVGSSSITKANYIKVTAIPDPPVANSISVCEGEPVPSLTAVGTGIKWYKAGVYIASGNTLQTGQSGAGTFTYSATQTLNGCQSEPAEVTLTINALPVVTFVMEDSLCSNAVAFNLNGGNPLGGIYSGTGVGENGITFDPSLAGAGTHQLLYKYTDGNSCSDSATHLITINAAPEVTMDPIPAICQNSPEISLNVSPTGGVFVGPGVTGNQFDPAQAGVGDFTVSYTYTDPISACSSTANQIITVRPLPEILVSDTSLCGNRVLSLDATVPNAVTYQWTPGNQNTAVIQIDTTSKGLGQFPYTVSVTDENGCIALKTVKVTFFDCTGIDEPATATGIDLYPNPNSGQFNIEANSIPVGTYTLRIFNMQGNRVYEEEHLYIREDYRKELNLKSLANGIYQLRIENSSAAFSKRFIIIR